MTLRERLARALCAATGNEPDEMVGGDVPLWLEEDDPLTKALIEEGAVQHPRWMNQAYFADAVLAEIAAAGMVLVPREPTEAMLRCVTPYRNQDHDTRAVYGAMLSAAPAGGE